MNNMYNVNNLDKITNNENQLNTSRRVKRSQSDVGKNNVDKQKDKLPKNNKNFVGKIKSIFRQDGKENLEEYDNVIKEISRTDDSKKITNDIKVSKRKNSKLKNNENYRKAVFFYNGIVKKQKCQGGEWNIDEMKLLLRQEEIFTELEKIVEEEREVEVNETYKNSSVFEKMTKKEKYIGGEWDTGELKALLEQEGTRQKTESELSKKVGISEKTITSEKIIEVEEQEEIPEVITNDTVNLGGKFVISYPFYWNGEVICTEQAERIDTIPMRKKQLLGQKQHFVQQMKNTKDMELIAKCVNKINRIDEQLKHCNSLEGDWISTTVLRRAFNPKVSNLSTREAKLAFPSHILPNLWYNEVLGKEGERLNGIIRSAAISDFCHQEVDLLEMILFLHYSEGKKEIDKPVEKAILFQTSIMGNLMGKALSTKKYLAAVEKRIAQSYISDTSKKITIEIIKQLICEREEILISQFLLDLTAHLTKVPAKKDIDYVRISLVDMTKAPETSEPHLHEFHQALDMVALFTILNGCQVCFDQTDEVGAFFDGKVIHMPKNLSQGIEECVLNPLFFNVSVQGNCSNDGIQMLINNIALSELSDIIKCRIKGDTPLEKLIVQKMSELEECFENFEATPEYAYYVNGLIMNLMALLDFYLSFGCYGGKDRTGGEGCEHTSNTIENYASPIIIDETERSEWMMKEVDWKLVDDINTVSFQISYINTGVAGLKISASNFSLYHGNNEIKARNTFRALKSVLNGYQRSPNSPEIGKRNLPGNNNNN